MKGFQRRQIERLLDEFGNPDSEARKRYEAAAEKWDKAIKPLQDAIDRSTQFTAEDFNIRINVKA